LWDRFWVWVARHLGDIIRAARDLPSLRWAVIAALCALAIALIGRVIYIAGTHDAASLRRKRTAPGGSGSRDPWEMAEELADRGEYTEAAHALYAALLGAVARAEPVRLHASKTAGDYARELRRLNSSRFGGFREFARAYETVVYGLGTCDRARYMRLLSLATAGGMNATGGRNAAPSGSLAA
jgi:hypothetical protein